MPKVPPKADSRTLVDRFVDRVKNDRIGAVLVIAVLAIGALASLTDSARKLYEALPSFSKVQVAGEWKSDYTDFLGWGPEFMRLNLQEAAAGQLLGRVQFSGHAVSPMRAFEVLNAKLAGNKLTLSFQNGGGGKPDTLVGEVVGGELHLVFQREGRGGVPFTARLTPLATQLLDGRLGIMHDGKEFPDPASGCAQLLRQLTPAQTLKQSDPPDEYGNVHCVGTQSNGSAGFDMYDNDVKLRLICPPNARKTFQTSEKPVKEKACECDGQLIASGTKCISAPPAG
jgi:hypothetical protein